MFTQTNRCRDLLCEVRSFSFLQNPVRLELYDALRRQEMLALLWVEIEGFTLFRRLFGRELGDAILRHLEKILKTMADEAIGDKELICVERSTEESFVMLFSNGQQSENDLQDLALRFQLTVRSQINQEVVKATGQTVKILVGGAKVPLERYRDLKHGLYFAMCKARQMATGNKDYQHLSLMVEFEELVKTPLLKAVYQPIVDLRTGKTLGWESLARGPEHNYFSSPKIMFNFAEEAGTLFALEQVCREQGIKGLGPLGPGQKLFMNIHPQTLADPQFLPGETLKLLKRYGLSPENVVFEITERHSIKDFSLFYRTLDHYRAQGYLIAVDDAGTGYSGLSRIAKLRPDYIKVDMSLVRGIDSNPVQRALLETMVAFAERIGCYITAEGIETATELSCLVSLGVHFGQGFYLARPANPKPEPTLTIPVRPSANMFGEANWKCSIPMQQLTEAVPYFGPQAPVKDVKGALDHHPISGVVVVDETDRPLGLVMSHNLDRQLSSIYGASLYYDRPVELVMDKNPLVVDFSIPVEEAAKNAMSRQPFKLYDHIIVTKEDTVLGVVSVQKMLDALARVQVEMAKGANPLTGLPGGVAIEREIEGRSGRGENTSFIYIDLDNFKAYNDSYGFEAGDRMLSLLAKILVWASRRHAGVNAFVGHIGGDDFVIIADHEKAERISLGTIRCFKRLVRHLYRQEDVDKGYVAVKGRDGNPSKFPLVSVSLGIVDSSGSADLKEIGRRAAEVKRYAKSIPGSVYVRDRRKRTHPQEEFPFPQPGKEN